METNLILSEAICMFLRESLQVFREGFGTAKYPGHTKPKTLYNNLSK